MKSIPNMVYESLKDNYNIPSEINISVPADILQIRKIANLSNKKQEEMIVITINTGGNVIKVRSITKGLLNHSLVHPREIFRNAILDNAHSIICVHNHPSGALEPSKADIDVTNQIKESGKIIGIELLDHIIVAKTGITSIRSLGYL